MFDVILAMDKNGGIGFNSSLPWKIPAELKHFRNVTHDSIVVMGRKTIDSLGKNFPNREIWCMSKSPNNHTPTFHNVEQLVKFINHCKYISRPIFIAGGGEIYRLFFGRYFDLVSKIHLSIVKNQTEEDYLCDTFVNLPPNLMVEKKIEYDQFTYYVLSKKPTDELQYLDLLRDTLRCKPRLGRNGLVFSHFTSHLKFDLTRGFPLLTTKKMFFRGIVEELLFFIRGDTDSKKLEEKGINIWKGNTSREFLDENGFTDRKEGDMGPMYGYQWRFFNKPYDEKNGNYQGLDQLQHVIDQIKTDPTSRRILLTDFNPLQAKEGVLYPCHSIIIQFYVEDGFLDMFCFNRSSDLFLGLPFNIASSALFLSIIANITDLTPRYLNLSLGDCHIYAGHKQAVEEQLNRFIRPLPSLVIKRKLELNDISFTDFELVNYVSEPSIKAEMVA